MKFRTSFRPTFLAISHALVAIQNKVTLRVVLLGNKSRSQPNSLIRLGSNYGGWWCPAEELSQPGKKILISAGLGYDTTFDALMLQNDFHVIGLDPLVDCCNTAKVALSGLGSFTILNSGISTFTGVQSFYQPRNPAHDSWSTINAQESDTGIHIDFDVISIRDIVSEFMNEDDLTFSYLKMDIEGAELAILNDSISDLLCFDFLAIEMDFLSLIPFLSIRKRYERIRNARKILKDLGNFGFRLVHSENYNFFWEQSK